jgi:hypothetical protein
MELAVQEEVEEEEEESGTGGRLLNAVALAEHASPSSAAPNNNKNNKASSCSGDFTRESMPHSEDGQKVLSSEEVVVGSGPGEESSGGGVEECKASGSGLGLAPEQVVQEGRAVAAEAKEPDDTAGEASALTRSTAAPHESPKVCA